MAEQDTFSHGDADFRVVIERMRTLLAEGGLDAERLNAERKWWGMAWLAEPSHAEFIDALAPALVGAAVAILRSIGTGAHESEPTGTGTPMVDRAIRVLAGMPEEERAAILSAVDGKSAARRASAIQNWSATVIDSLSPHLPVRPTDGMYERLTSESQWVKVLTRRYGLVFEPDGVGEVCYASSPEVRGDFRIGFSRRDVADLAVARLGRGDFQQAWVTGNGAAADIWPRDVGEFDRWVEEGRWKG